MYSLDERATLLSLTVFQVRNLQIYLQYFLNYLMYIAWQISNSLLNCLVFFKKICTIHGTEHHFQFEALQKRVCLLVYDSLTSVQFLKPVFRKICIIQNVAPDAFPCFRNWVIETNTNCSDSSRNPPLSSLSKRLRQSITWLVSLYHSAVVWRTDYLTVSSVKSILLSLK